MSEHGWPGWADEPAGPGPEHPDPHDGDLIGGGPDPGDGLRARGWAGDEAWDPAQDTPDGDPAGVPYDETPAGYADDTADASADGHGPDPRPGADGGPLGPVGADPDAVAESGADTDVAFPPAVHVGELPEPVDGFPWIDTGTLGVVAGDMIAADAAAGTYPAVDPADLAAYAQEDLPPAVDPWAVLAASDDPATSALARFWAQDR